MNKIALCTLMLFFASVAMAQHPQTRYSLDSTKYYVDWWYTDWYADTTHCLNCDRFSYSLVNRDEITGVLYYSGYIGEDLQRHMVEKGELTVYGLAVAGGVLGVDYATDDLNRPVTDFLGEEYLKIYEADDTSFRCLDSVRWHCNDPHDFLNIHVRGYADGPLLDIDTFCSFLYYICSESLPQYPFQECICPVPFYEYYFDHPVTVTDSFYIGYTAGNKVAWDSTSVYMAINTVSHLPLARAFNSFSFMGFGNNEGCPVMHPSMHKRIYYPNPFSINEFYPSDRWSYVMHDDYMMVYAIIAPPDTDMFECPAVENFRITGKGRDYAIFAWDTIDSQQQFRMSVVAWDADPNSSPSIRCNDNPMIVTSGLDTGRYYAAYIRPQCHHRCAVHDTTMWGSWSDPVYFYLGVCEPTEGPYSSIDAGLRPSTFALSPNPARNQVHITLMDAIEGNWIILTDATGRELFRKSAVGIREMTIPLNGYPDGMYYVTLVSSQGSCTQKLVVE